MRPIREALRLHLQAEMCYAEVGRALKISKSVVGNYVSLALCSALSVSAMSGREADTAGDALNWNRRDLSGATRQEFVARDVRAHLERHIVIVTGLLPLVHARFADDLAQARSAIESAQATIVRWGGYRAEAQA